MSRRAANEKSMKKAKLERGKFYGKIEKVTVRENGRIAGQILFDKLVSEVANNPDFSIVGRNKTHVWAICLVATDVESLIPRKLYRVESVGADTVRVTDETGGDVIYPATNFVFLKLPLSVERELANYD